MVEKHFVIKKTSANTGLFKQQRPRLSHIDIELTERCNNNCMHCYINLPADDQAAQRRELNTGQWKDILDQAAALGALWVRFTGGEPLLRADFPELYLHARRLGMKVYLFTNARLITPELADLFARVPPLKKIEISVYGMQAESYNAITRTKDGFEGFRRGIDVLLERNIPFVLKSVSLPLNRHERQAFESWAASLPDSVSPSYSNYLDLRARRDSPTKNRLIKSLRLAPKEALQLEARDKEAYLRHMAQFCAQFMFPRGDSLFNCGAGEAGCVDAYGHYQVCMMLRHPDTVYDLTQGSMQEALAEFFPRIKALRATNPAYLDRCAHCFLMGLCEQCPAKSWMEHGTLDMPVEYLCEVAHQKARFLGLLGEDEHGWKVPDWRERIERLVKRAQ